MIHPNTTNQRKSTDKYTARAAAANPRANNAAIAAEAARRRLQARQERMPVRSRLSNSNRRPVPRVISGTRAPIRSGPRQFVTGKPRLPPLLHSTIASHYSGPHPGGACFPVSYKPSDPTHASAMRCIARFTRAAYADPAKVAQYNGIYGGKDALFGCPQGIGRAMLWDFYNPTVGSGAGNFPATWLKASTPFAFQTTSGLIADNGIIVETTAEVVPPNLGYDDMQYLGGKLSFAVTVPLGNTAKVYILTVDNCRLLTSRADLTVSDVASAASVQNHGDDFCYMNASKFNSGGADAISVAMKKHLTPELVAPATTRHFHLSLPPIAHQWVKARSAGDFGVNLLTSVFAESGGDLGLDANQRANIAMGSLGCLILVQVDGALDTSVDITGQVVTDTAWQPHASSLYERKPIPRTDIMPRNVHGGHYGVGSNLVTAAQNAISKSLQAAHSEGGESAEHVQALVPYVPHMGTAAVSTLKSGLVNFGDNLLSAGASTAVNVGNKVGGSLASRGLSWVESKGSQLAGRILNFGIEQVEDRALAMML